MSVLLKFLSFPLLYSLLLLFYLAASLHISQVLQKLPLFASQALEAPESLWTITDTVWRKLNWMELNKHRYHQFCYSRVRQRAEIFMQAAKSDKCEISMKSMLTSTPLEQSEIDGLSAKAFLSLLWRKWPPEMGCQVLWHIITLEVAVGSQSWSQNQPENNTFSTTMDAEGVNN